MATLRFRPVSIVVAIALAVPLIMLTPFGALGLDPRTTPPDQKPVSDPSVVAKADDHGNVKVRWLNAPRNVTSVNVFRNGVNITPDGVRGHTFVDREAEPDTSYTYSVRVASVKKEQARSGEDSRAARAAVGQDLGSAEVKTGPAEASRADRLARATKARDGAISFRDGLVSRLKDSKGLTWNSAAASAAPASHISPEDCFVAGFIATDTTWSPTTCPDGYLLTGDVVVTDGATLTVAPGTTVWFATDMAPEFTGGFSPTIYGGAADLNGSGDVTGGDDSNAFYGATHIIDGLLDCDTWAGTNDGSVGDGAITTADDCTLVGYDGTADGVTITVTDGVFGWPSGTPLPLVFNAADPDNPDVGDSDFAWSTIDGRVDANGKNPEAITSDDCHLGLIGLTDDTGLGDPHDGADVVSDDGAGVNPCVGSPGSGPAGGTADNGKVDLNSDGDITADDSCTDGCFFGHDVAEGLVQKFGAPPPQEPLNGGFSPTIYGGKADLNGDRLVTGRDDADEFYGDTGIIDGKLDCNAWGPGSANGGLASQNNDGSDGDHAITTADDCTMVGYDGTSDGVTIEIDDGVFAWPNGKPLPLVFNAADPANPDIGDSDFAWSAIDGKVDSNGNEAIEADDCHQGIIGLADTSGYIGAAGVNILGSDPACPDETEDPPANNGFVDLNDDGTVSAADSCTDGCFFGHDVDEGLVQEPFDLAGTINPLFDNDKVDLLVFDGTMNINGSERVTFTSYADNDIDNPSATPAAGDWGYLAFSPLSSGNSISGADVSFGTAILAHETEPPVSNTTVTEHFGESLTGARYGVLYLDPLGPVTWDNFDITSTVDDTTAAFVFSPDADINGITATVTNSEMTAKSDADSPLCFFDLSVETAALVNANVSDSHFTQAGAGTPGSAAPGVIYGAIDGGTGSASISGSVTGVEIDNTGGGIGFFGLADASDGDATHTVSFSGNDFDADGDASRNLAFAGGDGNATIDYPVSSGTYHSDSGYAWFDLAVAGDGNAVADPDFNNVTLDSDGDAGLYAEADAGAGTATATPDLVNDSRITGSADAAYSYAFSDGDANSVMDMSDSLIKVDDGYYYVYADSDKGAANAGGTVTDVQATFGTFSYGFEFDAYACDDGGGGSSICTDPATASPVLTNVDVDSYYESLYTEAYNSGNGPATSNPVVQSGSRLFSDNFGGMEFYAYTDGLGDATSSPSVTDSQIIARSDDAFCSCNDGSSAYGDGNVASHPTIINSTLRSENRDAFDVWTYSYGAGDSDLHPTVANSVIRNVFFDYGIYSGAYAYGTGNAHRGGTYTDSTIRGYYYGVYLYVETNDIDTDAMLDPFWGNVTIIGDNADGFYGEVNNYGAGTAKANPSFVGGSLTGDQDCCDYGLELYAYGLGSATTDVIEVAPSLDGTPVRGYYGVYLDASDADTHPGQSHVGGSFSNSLIEGVWGGGFQGYAYSGYSTNETAALLDTEFVSMSLHGYEEAVYASAYTEAFAAAGALNQPTFTGVQIESFQNDGIEYDTNGSPGDATSILELRNTRVASGDDGIEIDNFGNDDGFVDVTIVDNQLRPSSSDDGSGIDIGSFANDVANLTGTISGNDIRDRSDEGIHLDMFDTTAQNIDVLISGNTIENVDDEGIEVLAEESLTGPGDVVSIVGNTVRRTGREGIHVRGAIADIRFNSQSTSGLDSGSDESNSGIVVRNHPASAAAGGMECNTAVKNKFGVRFDDNPDDKDPVTNLNNFADADGNTNSTFNLTTDNDGTTDATRNWWGTTDPDAIDAKVQNTGTGTVDTSSPLTAPDCARLAPGYWLLESNGGVHARGGAGFFGSAFGVVPSGATDLDSTSTTNGYWIVENNGGVHARGDAGFFGAAFGFTPSGAKSIAGVPGDCGYLIAEANGGVHARGCAGFFGSAFGVAASPVVGIASTPTGGGYWIFEANGGVHARGDAAFFGAAFGLVPSGGTDGDNTSTGLGYWIVENNGGVHARGDAGFFGAAFPFTPSGASGISGTTDDLGYWVTEGNGGVHARGTAPFLGNAFGVAASPVVDIEGKGS